MLEVAIGILLVLLVKNVYVLIVATFIFCLVAIYAHFRIQLSAEVNLFSTCSDHLVLNGLLSVCTEMLCRLVGEIEIF